MPQSQHVALSLYLAEITLASLTAKPIYQVQYGNDWRDVERAQYDDHAAHGSPVRIVYAAPPAPVVPDERASFNAWNNDTDCPLAGLTVKQAAWLAWLKRSGTIKSFGNNEELEPVSNRDELPATQQPHNAQQNIPNNIPGGLIEAVNDLLNNDGSRGRYSAIGCGNAREKIELWLSQRQKWESQRDKNISAGNHPVIPDGWVMLPSEPTQAMMNAWLSEVANWRGHAAGYRAMIAAAPQQEVK